MTSNGGTLYIQFAGSGWRGSAGKVSVDLLMDGTVIATASVFTNEASSHKSLVPVAVLIPAAAGQHTFTVAPTPGSGTNIDQNDYFTVTVNEATPNHFEVVDPMWVTWSRRDGASRAAPDGVNGESPSHSPNHSSRHRKSRWGFLWST